MFHTFVTRTSIDAHVSLHASIRPRVSRLASPSRGASRRRCPPTLSSLLAARPRPRETRTRETRPRRDRDEIDRPRVGERERTREATETRDAIERARFRPSRAETKRNDDMSAKSGSGKGKSARGNRTTPFATMSVSPFLWCVEMETEETMRGGDDEGKARSGRERETRERMNECARTDGETRDGIRNRCAGRRGTW